MTDDDTGQCRCPVCGWRWPASRSLVRTRRSSHRVATASIRGRSTGCLRRYHDVEGPQLSRSFSTSLPGISITGRDYQTEDEADGLAVTPDDPDHVRCEGRLLPIDVASDFLEDAEWCEQAEHVDELRDVYND